mmetsp:Transcript_94342/g.177550  ORF Transcript_94342/g.177550 Transcript_94342/m.177550 type:complete len:575 (+) Transcript_94342:125-1849(+)
MRKVGVGRSKSQSSTLLQPHHPISRTLRESSKGATQSKDQPALPLLLQPSMSKSAHPPSEGVSLSRARPISAMLQLNATDPARSLLQSNESNSLRPLSKGARQSKGQRVSTMVASQEMPAILMQSNVSAAGSKSGRKRNVVKKLGFPASKPSTPAPPPQSTAATSPAFPADACLPPPIADSTFSSLRRRSSVRFEKPSKYFIADEDLEDKLVGVVITIFSGSSYDPMFREIRPTTVPGERISTYSMRCSAVEQFRELLVLQASIRMLGTLHSLPQPAVELLQGYLFFDEWLSLMRDVCSVPADGVVFNWECCSSCGDNCPFPCSGGLMASRKERKAQALAQSSSTMKLMGLAVRSGYTVMCSDFSLKSLIFEWSEEELGPNPFLQLGSCSGQFSLDFVPAELQCEEVPQQLQVVGELCADAGKAIVSASSNTIVYTVNPQRQATDVYDLKVLTVVEDIATCSLQSSASDESKCSVGVGDARKQGWAGHVTLTYAAGGQLVTSMGHWIEMSRVDTSLESVIRVAARNFGGDEVGKIRTELATVTSEDDRSSIIQKHARSMVTKSAAGRMKGRTKF